MKMCKSQSFLGTFVVRVAVAGGGDGRKIFCYKH